MTKSYCTFSPDTICGVYIGDACKRHDEMYQRDPKPNNVTRKYTDQLFRGRLKSLLNKWYNCWIPYLYYFAVRIFCYPSWQRWKYYWLWGFIPIRVVWK